MITPVSAGLALAVVVLALAWRRSRSLSKRRIRDLENALAQARKIMEAEKQEAQNQFKQAQKMEAIGLLTSGIAHDFNNMLAAISGFAEIIQLKYGRTNSVLNGFSGSILDTARRAADLTGRLLTYVRKDKGEVITLDANAAVRDVMSLLNHTIDRRIILIDKCLEEPVPVMASRVQLQGAIMNLGVNARDAMPEGGAMTFSVEVVEVDERFLSLLKERLAPGRYARITVADTGCGMDKATLDRLFEPLFTTKEEGKGTGLGLASVYATVKSLRGAVEVDSKPGKGSNFSLVLPLAGTPAAEGICRPASLVHGTGRILLIDDEPVILEMYKAMLEELGYGAWSAPDGAQGAAWYREHWKEIDLVILDIIMPNAGGLECYRRLLETNPAVKVIVSSGYQAGNEVQKMLDLGAKGFIQKPVDMLRFSQMIADVLQGRK